MNMAISEAPNPRPAMAAGFAMIDRLVGDVEQRDAEQPEPDHGHPHHAPAPEGEGEGGAEPLPGRLRGPGARPHGRGHPDVAGDRREGGSHEEADGVAPPVFSGMSMKT